MREFTRGTPRQYTALKASLDDGACHVYQVAYPPGFSRDTGRLGFEKEAAGNTYALYIDRGITYSGPASSALLRDWLAAGTLHFLDFTDLAEFLRGLKRCYT